MAIGLLHRGKSANLKRLKLWALLSTFLLLQSWYLCLTILIMRQFKSEVQQELMSENKVLRKGFDSQEIFVSVMNFSPEGAEFWKAWIQDV
jgi:hypothetical protein